MNAQFYAMQAAKVAPLSAVAAIQHSSLKDAIGRYREGLQKMLDGEDYSIPLSFDGYIGVLNTDTMKQLLDAEPGDEIQLWVRSEQSSSSAGRMTITAEELEVKIREELDTINTESRILQYLSNASVEASPSLIASRISDICSEGLTSASSTLNQFFQELISVCPDVPSMLTAIYDSITGVGEASQNVFTPSQVGSVTNTTGLGLWWANVKTALGEFFTAAYETVKSGLSKWRNIVKTELFGWWYKANAKVNYAVSNVILDEFFNIEESNVSQGYSIDNGFFDTGLTITKPESELLELGFSKANAMCVPLLGATWYLWMDPDNSNLCHIGLSKHMYQESYATRMRSLASRTGNDLETVAFIAYNSGLAPDQVLHHDTNLWQTPTDYNYYLLRCLHESEKLIPLGLLSLADANIVNAYYQDPNLTLAESFRDMFVGNATHGDSVANRADVAHDMQYYSYEWDAFITGAFLNYLNSLTDYEDDRAICHYFSTVTEEGYISFQDDATVASEVKAGFKTFGIALAATAAVVAGFVITKNLKASAFAARRAADLAAFDSSISTKEAFRLAKRARLLESIAGVTTTAVTTPITPLSSVTGEPDLSGVTTTLDGIKKLIKS